MADDTSIVNIGELSKPATVLIEKISDAVGGIFKPYQIVRVAKAEAEADRIRTEADIQITDIQRRAFQRFLHEEARKQKNIEDVTRLALPQIQTDATPETVNDDWIVNFFDKCRLTSDHEIQQVWARILAGEANAPGTFSRRTVNFLASLDKSDAEQFTALCSCCWNTAGSDLVPLVFDVADKIYNASGIGFNTATHLESIGLVKFEPLTGFRRIGLAKEAVLSYFGRLVRITLSQDSGNEINVGKVLLTRMGLELAPICGAAASEAFFKYVIEKWRAEGYSPSLGDNAG